MQQTKTALPVSDTLPRGVYHSAYTVRGRRFVFVITSDGRHLCRRFYRTTEQGDGAYAAMRILLDAVDPIGSPPPGGRRLRLLP